MKVIELRDKLKEGMKVEVSEPSATITGIIGKMEGNRFWIFQDEHDGDRCSNPSPSDKGCKYSWSVNKDSNYELKILDISKQSLKQPTHVVLWDEKLRDPHRFFFSQKEADDFVKTLIDKSEVIKESIAILEIKKAEKIAIIKTVRRGKLLV